MRLLPLLRQPSRRWPAIVSFHGADVLVELERPEYRKALIEMLGRVDLVLAPLGVPERRPRAHRLSTGKNPDQSDGDSAGEISFPGSRLAKRRRVAAAPGVPAHRQEGSAYDLECVRRVFARLSASPADDRVGKGRAWGTTRASRSGTGHCGQGSSSPVSSARMRFSPGYTSPTFSCTRANRAVTGTRKACRTRCWKPCPRVCRSFATTHGGIPEAIENGGERHPRSRGGP